VQLCLGRNATRTFVGHLDQMLVNVDSNIEQAKANENNAWGGFSEDRIAYMYAKLKTGASDPASERQLRELGQQRVFVRESRVGLDHARELFDRARRTVRRQTWQNRIPH